MRRLFACAPGCAVARRAVSVGPNSALPTASPTPTFGKKRRAESATDEKATPASMDKAASDAARTMCYEKYDFLQKPAYMVSWVPFLDELRNIELSWALAPAVGSSKVYVLRLKDYRCPDKDHALCELRGLSTMCQPIPEFFACSARLVAGEMTGSSIYFYDMYCKQKLYVEPHKHVQHATNHDEPPMQPYFAQYDTRHTSVSIALIDEKTNAARQLVSRISLQTFNYALLTSIPAFLKRVDMGLRNADFVSRDQMQQFRFAWCTLRRESCMKPVDIGELDHLLPT